MRFQGGQATALQCGRITRQNAQFALFELLQHSSRSGHATFAAFLKCGEACSVRSAHFLSCSTGMRGPTCVRDSCHQLVLRETAPLLKATRSTVLCLSQGEYRQRLLSGPSKVGQLHLRPFQQEDMSGAWLAQSANDSTVVQVYTC